MGIRTGKVQILVTVSLVLAGLVSFKAGGAFSMDHARKRLSQSSEPTKERSRSSALCSMLRWQVLPNAVVRHPETRIWYEVFGWTNKQAPHWKVSIARLGPALLMLGFIGQFLGTLFWSLGLH